MSETQKDQALCTHAIQDDQVMIVNDATLDERVASNPLGVISQGFASMPVLR